MLRASDSLKTVSLVTTWPRITVLNNFIVFTEMPFLLTNGREIYTEIAPTKYKKRCYAFWGTGKCLLHFHFSTMAYHSSKPRGKELT